MTKCNPLKRLIEYHYGLNMYDGHEQAKQGTLAKRRSLKKHAVSPANHRGKRARLKLRQAFCNTRSSSRSTKAAFVTLSCAVPASDFVCVLPKIHQRG